MPTTQEQKTSEPGGGLTFPKSRRILKRLEYKRVFDAQLKVVSHELVVFARPNRGPGRIGLVVSKKVGNAVVRNRVKRILREAFRQCEDCPSWDLVVVARHTCASAGYKQICDALMKSQKRLRRRLQNQGCPG